jgi:hypothetical protein
MNLTGLTVYLSGPITGDQKRAAKDFDAAAAKARKLGAVRAFNPLRACEMHTGRDHAQYMRHCLHELTRGDLSTSETEYDVLLLLDGWRESAGCLAEVVAAHAIGCEVVELWQI